jgi:hypothetical protein
MSLLPPLRRDSYEDRVCDDLSAVLLSHLSFTDACYLLTVSKQFERTVLLRQRQLHLTDMFGTTSKRNSCSVDAERLALLLNRAVGLQKLVVTCAVRNWADVLATCSGNKRLFMCLVLHSSTKGLAKIDFGVSFAATRHLHLRHLCAISKRLITVLAPQLVTLKVKQRSAGQSLERLVLQQVAFPRLESLAGLTLVAQQLAANSATMQPLLPRLVSLAVTLVSDEFCEERALIAWLCSMPPYKLLTRNLVAMQVSLACNTKNPYQPVGHLEMCFAPVAQELTCLRRLTVRFVTSRWNASVLTRSTLPLTLPRLTHLALHALRNDFCVRPFQCPRLISLELVRIRPTTQNLFQACPRLVALSMELSNLYDLPASHMLGIARLQHLKHLLVTFRQKNQTLFMREHASNLGAILAGCTRLQSLSFVNCTVSDQVLALVASQPSLTQHLVNCISFQ